METSTIPPVMSRLESSLPSPFSYTITWLLGTHAPLPSTCFLLYCSVPEMSNLASELGQIDKNGANLGLFKEPSQNLLNLILKNSRFVPFGANLTLFVCQI